MGKFTRVILIAGILISLCGGMLAAPASTPQSCTMQMPDDRTGGTIKVYWVIAGIELRPRADSATITFTGFADPGLTHSFSTKKYDLISAEFRQWFGESSLNNSVYSQAWTYAVQKNELAGRGVDTGKSFFADCAF